MLSILSSWASGAAIHHKARMFVFQTESEMSEGAQLVRISHMNSVEVSSRVGREQRRGRPPPVQKHRLQPILFESRRIGNCIQDAVPCSPRQRKRATTRRICS
jgi:hypothetical protein